MRNEKSESRVRFVTSTYAQIPLGDRESKRDLIAPTNTDRNESTFSKEHSHAVNKTLKK